MIKHFQTIQTAFFHKKFAYKMFRSNFTIFLDLQGSFVKNKDESQEKTDSCVQDFLFSTKLLKPNKAPYKTI